MNTIDNRDDTNFLYNLRPHKWCTYHLYVGDITHIFQISHVFENPIGDAIEATILLLKGASEVEFVWRGEPGGNRWKIIRKKDRRDWITIAVTDFSSCYGKIIKDLPGCFTQGETLEETMANIQEARELWIETAYEMGDPIPLPNNTIEYSGKFLLIMPKSLHRDLVQKAEAEAVSLNQYISSVLSRSVN